MSIVLYTDAKGRERINVENVDIQSLLEEKFIILDTCILFPAILPRKRRNLQMVKRCEERLYGKYSYTRWRNIEKYVRRRIDVVNAIEDGKFLERGYYFGVTNEVFDELYGLSNACGEENLKTWFKNTSDSVYMIYLYIKDFRKRHKVLSDNLSDNGDFSVAIASYVLGSPFASDDYGSFNLKIMKNFREMYRRKWGIKRKFERHDSESLLMNLKSKS